MVRGNVFFNCGCSKKEGGDSVKYFSKLIIFVLCASLMFTVFTGCEQEGPAEKAGEKIDEAVENAGEAMEEAGEEIQDGMN